MNVVAYEREEVDPSSVTAQFPAVDAYGFGPRDPNPPGEQPPRRAHHGPDHQPSDGSAASDGPAGSEGPAGSDGRSAVAHQPGLVSRLGGAVAAAVLAAGIAVAANHGTTVLLLAVAGGQFVLVLTWVFGTVLPGRAGALVIGVLAAAGADLIVWHWPDGQLGTLVVVLGLAIPAMFLHQLARGVVRVRVVESLSDVALLVVSVVAMAVFAQLGHETLGTRMVNAVALAAGGGLVIGQLVDLVCPVPRFDPQVRRGLLAVVIAAAAGAVIGYVRLHDTADFVGNRSLYLGASVAAVVSLLAVGAAYVQHGLPPSGRLAAIGRTIACAFVPLALLAPIGYLLCLAIRT